KGGDPYYWLIDGTGDLVASIKSGGQYTQYQTTTALSQNNKWQMLTFTYDGDAGSGQKIKYYVNSQNFGTTILGGYDNGGTPDDTSGTTNIGMLSASNAYTGSIDNYQIFNYTLSQSDVIALYNQTAYSILSAETEIGDIWQACITPSDDEVTGSTNCSNTLTILNSAPTQTAPILNSTSGTNGTNDNLTLYTFISDSEGDTIYKFINWYRNSSLIYNYSRYVVRPSIYSTLHMPFDDSNWNNNTFARDYSPYANNGTVTNAVWNSTGGFDGNGAYYYSGSDYINIGDISQTEGATNLTVMAWIKFDGSPNLKAIVSKDSVGAGGRSWILQTSNSNPTTPNFYLSGDGTNVFGTTSSSTIANDGTWHHVVGVYTIGSHPDIYIDGELNNGGSTGAASSTIANTVTPVRIGATSTGARGFIGNIDEVRIYDRVVSIEEIRAIYKNSAELIQSQDTTLADVWQACVTPNDGTSDGSTDCSNNLTVVDSNTAPGQPTLTYPNGGEYFTNSTLINITWTASTDAENDTLTYYTYYSDDNGSTWNFINTTTNNYYEWTPVYINSNQMLINITPNDGDLNGTSDWSDNTFKIGHCDHPGSLWYINNVVIVCIDKYIDIGITTSRYGADVTFDNVTLTNVFTAIDDSLNYIYNSTLQNSLKLNEQSNSIIRDSSLSTNTGGTQLYQNSTSSFENCNIESLGVYSQFNNNMTIENFAPGNNINLNITSHNLPFQSTL
ncbi:LamG-like jellyroll fold domain-containing protein, partial [Nanoarchaeota archaeon]